eukprot:SAG11_NODE_1045_length_6044_cov_12.936249_2_plen_60_part_00
MLMYLNYKMDNWVSITPQIMWAINNSPSDALSEGRTPLFVDQWIYQMNYVSSLTKVDRI